jgi:hypothetical protein
VKYRTPPSVLARQERRKRIFQSALNMLLPWPHVTENIAKETATEFVSFGRHDMVVREISRSEWLWRRSRYLAGFK